MWKKVTVHIWNKQLIILKMVFAHLRIKYINKDKIAYQIKLINQMNIVKKVIQN